ncbi:hypothetical protein C8A03DRAFT_40685 [Achaetomium macrosporum]|uniref:Uncharacterized protein n=1 Tax=Achaetomium macrosporum TaxID=79813 RepID=A0AAN7CH76_9PEZI|nr:hypothetical protein C8A03DRAFT_40685 [Achaetomium macrosporum]
MADPDPSVSNGTCFYAAEQVASDNFIPCGNWAFGHYHCCQTGDWCLEDNACYNGEHGTTYLAGCTDIDYKDQSCPDKDAYKDYPWAGLIYCKPNRWVACEEKNKPSTITKGDPCTCPPESATMTVAFSAPGRIEGIGILPATSGGTIEWAEGHFPTVQPSSTTSSSTSETTEFLTSSSFTSVTSGSRLPTSTTTSVSSINSPPHNHHLSDGAKAGIAIGSAVGGILLLGALSALWVVLRHRRTDKDAPSSPQAAASTQTDKSPVPGSVSGSMPTEMPTPVVPPRPAYPELPVGPRVMRPELQGDVTPTGYGHVSPPTSPAEPSWQSPNQALVGMVPLSTVADGRELNQHQTHQAHGQGEQVEGSSRQTSGFAFELPA